MKNRTSLHSTLFSWWRKNGRVLPWREKEKKSGDTQTLEVSRHKSFSVRERTFDSYFSNDVFRDPYRVVVSEVMLQQTQVDRVLPKYCEWMKKWPRIEDLAKASLAEVIIEWKGLGYNRRARFLWLLAKEIEGRSDGWPTTEKELLKLPGIGRYTARAIMSFAFRQHVGVVDTNVKRILNRVFFEQEAFTNDSSYFDLADQILPSALSDPWNQALMDFGALVCSAKNPHCDVCPIATLCDANKNAQKKGYEDYAKQLCHETKNESLKMGKTHAQNTRMRFEQTSRFLRGRALDLLREKEWREDEFITILSTKYTQFNLAQIQENIDKLIKEKMIKKDDEKISLR